MRPPSYYASIVKRNNTTTSLAYGQTDYDSPRTSSQQLRSSLSSSSSSSYVQRSHLPFVPQSTLVAHCFTGVGSSTRPYGGANSSSSSSAYLTNSTGSLSTSRQPSTKSAYSMHSSYLSNASPSSSYLRSSSYLTPSISLASSSSSSRHSRPTTATSGSYYKPIRLRERPLLTQISRQINSPTPPRPTSRNAVEEHHEDKTTHSSESETTSSRLVPNDLENSDAINKRASDEQEASWSSDIGRNISRNKYLIKFREIDKKSEPSSTVHVEATCQLPPPPPPPPEFESNPSETTETTVIISAPKLAEKLDQRTELVEPSEKRPETEMRLDQGVKETKDELKSSKLAVKREKKNVKLKLRQVAGGPATAPTASTTIEAQVESAKVKSKAMQRTKAPTKENTPPPQPLEPIKQNVAVEEINPTKPVKVKRVIKSKENRRESGGELTTLTTTAKKKDSDKSGRLDSATPKVKTKRPKKAKELVEPEPNSQELVKEKVLESKHEKSNKVTSSAPSSPRVKLDRIRFREYNYDDFNFLTVLGHGGWGFVILAELKDYDACFAVKCIKKITIVEDDDYDSIMIERKVLALGNLHPFICKLFCTFETAGYLFFVMEYCPGGDLMFHVQHEGKFSESRCRFYAAEIICAIRFLHNRHIIYRDLKLDNILLDSSGHIRLVDFGMCQCRTYREEMLPSNFCGTPEYISPEIIKGVPYNHSVDWWSFGVLLYEMAVGKMPFRGNDENELLWNVCYEQIHYPMFLTKELTSLLKLLLEREPNLRMGMATCKAGDIYEQPFFRGVDWKAVEEMRVEPPFRPEVKSNRDVSNFDSDFTESTCELSPVDESTLAKIDQAQFQQFPYTNPDLFIFDSNPSASSVKLPT